MKQYSILPADCYNMDEIGFQEGQGRADSILILFTVIEHSNRVYIHR
ncbi:predicted protein [Histoplasma mississippiense (nom. inval.)]|nr:predicted protein [Histoplasma mississippiense (nom. inval.)]EDN06144.1 predicted protein [Histoplasma mississippiense (nom. inval.)]